MRNFLLALFCVLILTKVTEAQILYPHVPIKQHLNEMQNKTLDSIMITLYSLNSLGVMGGDSSSKTQVNRLSRLIERMRAIKIEEPDNRISILGLGNIASTQNGEGLNPSANIITQILPFKGRANRRLYLGYNFGAELDSTKKDSIKIGQLFLPDRTKSGYLFRAEIDMFPFIKELFKPRSNNALVSKEEDKSEYIFNTELSPFIEYNYNKINFKEVHEDSSKIETSSWLFGLSLIHTLSRNDNSVAFQVSSYYKRTIITDGTFGTYNNLFKSNFSSNNAPQKVNFLGLILGLRINRFQFAFIVDDLKSKSLKETQLYGGVYTIRATVIGDFLNL